jgi:arginase
VRRIAVLDAPSNLGLRPPTATSVPGCAKAPGALRDHGLLTRLGARDAGCLTPPRYDAGDWRPGDGVAHAQQIAAYSRALADRIGAILDAGEFPVILGGDCSILLGSGIAMHRLGEAIDGRIGLVFVDGHSDFRHPGNASYVGAAAGEDLALVTGRGQADLASIEGRRPYFRDIDVVVLGIRAQDEYRLDLQAAGIITRPVPALRAEGAARSAQWAREQLTDCAGYWVHIDVDVLDPAVMPAVDAPSPGGIAFPELELLLAGLVESPHCLGVEVTVFDPDYDPDGEYAAEITSTVAAGLAAAHKVARRPDLAAARRDLDDETTRQHRRADALVTGFTRGPTVAAESVSPAAEAAKLLSAEEGAEPPASSPLEDPDSAGGPALSEPADRLPEEADAPSPDRQRAGESGLSEPTGDQSLAESSDASDKAARGKRAGGLKARGEVALDGAARGDAVHGGAAQGEAAHGEAAHGEAAHGEAAHGEAAHGGAARGGPARGDAARGGAARGDAVHGGAARAGAARGDAARGGAARGDAVHGEAAGDVAGRDEGSRDEADLAEGVHAETDPDEAAHGEAARDQAAHGEAAPDQAAPDQAAPDQAASDDAASDDAPSDEVAPDEAASGKEAARDGAFAGEAVGGGGAEQESGQGEPAKGQSPRKGGRRSRLGPRNGSADTTEAGVRFLSRPLGSAPLLDSEPLPATRPGMLRPRRSESSDDDASTGATAANANAAADGGGFSLPAQRPAFDAGSGEPADIT